MRIQLKTKDGLHILFEMHVWDIINLMIYEGKLKVHSIDNLDLFVGGKLVLPPVYPDEEA